MQAGPPFPPSPSKSDQMPCPVIPACLPEHAHSLLSEFRSPLSPTRYCDSLLSSTPISMLLPFLKCKFDHVSSLSKILHLLLITFGIKSKLVSMPHKVLCDLAPIYCSGLKCSHSTSLPLT